MKISTRILRAALTTLAAALTIVLAGGGCDRVSHPRDASPIVGPDSEAGRKALAESARLLELRQKQEAASRKRYRGLPVEG